TQALAKSESTQTQLDTIVIDGDSSVEAAQARVSVEGTPYATLKQRLDTEYEEVTTQLALNEQEIVKKADRNYVDEQLSNIGSAKPSGVFSTLSELQSAYPNGDGDNYY